MGIDFESGEFNRRQHRLEDDQVFPMIKEVKSHQGVYVAYIDIDGLKADKEKKLWIDPCAIAYPPEEADFRADEFDMCRVIKIPKGIIVDASCGDFVMNGDSPRKLPRDTDTDFDLEGWVPSIGLIITDSQRTAVENAIYDKYDAAIGESVLLLYEVGGSEENDDID